MEFDNILTLAGKFKSNVELQEYCNQQYVALEKALKRIHELDLEVAHLKELLAGTTPLVQSEPKVELLPGSAEQSICEIQINMLQDVAKQRPLTLEETKRLDILIKNLYLAKSQNAAIPVDYTKLPPQVSEAQLIALAAVQDAPSDAE